MASDKSKVENIVSKKRVTKQRAATNTVVDSSVIAMDTIQSPNSSHGTDVTHQIKSPASKGNSDSFSIALLVLLYTLQGIPMGLSGSIPLILKEKGATYEALSLFSLVSIPFSLKLMWAPLVDSYYFKSFGRRKTWLVPIQLITGIVMIVGSYFIGDWLGGNVSDRLPAVEQLTIYFIFLYFLMATQDIAVDGWALTMLSRESVGYASVCNSIGQVLGIFIANQGFIALSDAKWCHRHLGYNEGPLVDLPNFMQFWGYVFILVTIFVWIFKKEEEIDTTDHPEGLIETCQHIIAVFRLPAIQTFVLILLTCRLGFASSDAVFGFKLQEYGMPKADMATISPLLLLTSLLLPAVAGSVVSSRPLDVVLWALPVRLILTIPLWMILQRTPEAYASAGEDGPDWKYYAPLILLLLLNEIASTLMFISFMSFFSKISDPSIGGSYMTLLNTVTNLGSKWPASLSLWLLPKMTFHICESTSSGEEFSVPIDVPCTLQHHTECKQRGGQCNIGLDGFTVQVCGSIVIGALWLIIFRSRIQSLQSLPHADWLIRNSSKGR